MAGGLPEIPLKIGGFGNALVQGSQAGYDNARSRIDQQQADRESDAQQYVQPAMSGDQQAMGKLAYGDPRAAMAVTTALQRMDANQRANIKSAADYTAQASNAVLQADPQDRPAIYQQMYAEGQRRGYKMDGLPPQYTPQVDATLRSHRAMAVPITEWFKQNEGMPTPIGGAGGGGGLPQGGAAPAPGGFANNSGNIRSTAPGSYNGFATYATPDEGARAHFQNYQAYVQQNPNITVAQALAKWSPPSENNTNGIISQLSEATGINPGMRLADVLSDPAQAARLLQAQTQLEKGGMPAGFTPDTFLRAATPQGAPNGGPPVANGPPVQLSGPPQGAPAGVLPPGVQVAGPPQAGPGAAPAPAAAPPPVQGLTAGVQLPPGARMMGIKGVPVVKDGNVLIQTQDGAMDWVPIPQRPPAAAFEDVKDANGNLIGQRNKATNQYHAVTQVPGASSIDPNLKGDDVYAALPPARAAEIRSIVEGDNPIPPPTSRAPYAQETRALVFQAAGPGFTDAMHAQRMAMKKDMNTGKIGQALQAQGTLYNHFDHLLDLGDAINNSPYPLANKVLNAVGLAQGDPRVVEMEATKTRINQELEKYTAGHTTVSGLSEARNELNAAQSPEQIKGAVRTLTNLINGQQSELVHRINRGLGYTGDKALTLEDPLIISPEGAKARDDVLSRTQANPSANSKLMDQGKQLFGAKKPGERPPLESFQK